MGQAMSLRSSASRRDSNAIILDMMTAQKSHSIETNEQPKNKTLECRMKLMLIDEQQFEDFVQFMIKEFSSETILSFVEFVQWKQRLIEYAKLDGIDNHLLSEHIPKSSIVYVELKESEMKVFNESAHLLFEKYIKIGAEF